MGVPRQSRCAARTDYVKVSPEACAATAATLPPTLNQVGGGSWATQGAHSPAAAAHDDPWGVPTDDGDYYHLENWSNSDGEDEEDGAVEVLRHVDDPRDDMSDTDEEDQGDLIAQAEEDEREQNEDEEEDGEELDGYEEQEQDQDGSEADEQHVLFR